MLQGKTLISTESDGDGSVGVSLPGVSLDQFSDSCYTVGLKLIFETFLQHNTGEGKLRHKLLFPSFCLKL